LRDIPELASSLRTYGLLQPVVVRPVDGGYVLLAGHRRVEAARSLGWETIAAIVRPATDDEAYLLTVVDNLQRQDLSPREESAALEVLVREHGWTTRQVAAAISRSQAFVSKRLRVFDDPALGPAVLANQLSVSAAEELLSIPAAQRPGLLRKITRGKWDLARVRQAVVAERFGPTAVAAERRPALGRRIEELREELRGLNLAQLRASERRQLRMLYADLGVLA
jgi:ParB family chromosome partitioning protein